MRPLSPWFVVKLNFCDHWKHNIANLCFLLIYLCGIASQLYCLNSGMFLASFLIKYFFNLWKICFLYFLEAHLLTLCSLFLQLFHRHHTLEIIVPEAAGVGAEVIRNRLGVDTLELFLIEFLGQHFEYVLSHMSFVRLIEFSFILVSVKLGS